MISQDTRKRNSMLTSRSYPSPLCWRSSLRFSTTLLLFFSLLCWFEAQKNSMLVSGQTSTATSFERSFQPVALLATIVDQQDPFYDETSEQQQQRLFETSISRLEHGEMGVVFNTTLIGALIPNVESTSLCSPVTNDDGGDQDHAVVSEFFHKAAAAESKRDPVCKFVARITVQKEVGEDTDEFVDEGTTFGVDEIRPQHVSCTPGSFNANNHSRSTALYLANVTLGPHLNQLKRRTWPSASKIGYLQIGIATVVGETDHLQGRSGCFSWLNKTVASTSSPLLPFTIDGVTVHGSEEHPPLVPLYGTEKKEGFNINNSRTNDVMVLWSAVNITVKNDLPPPVELPISDLAMDIVNGLGSAVAFTCVPLVHAAPIAAQLSRMHILLDTLKCEGDLLPSDEKLQFFRSPIAYFLPRSSYLASNDAHPSSPQLSTYVTAAILNTGFVVVLAIVHGVVVVVVKIILLIRRRSKRTQTENTLNNEEMRMLFGGEFKTTQEQGGSQQQDEATTTAEADDEDNMGLDPSAFEFSFANNNDGRKRLLQKRKKEKEQAEKKKATEEKRRKKELDKRIREYTESKAVKQIGFAEWRQAMAAVHFPGLLIVPYMFLAQSTVSSAMLATQYLHVSNRDELRWVYVVIAVGVLWLAVVPVGLLYVGVFSKFSALRVVGQSGATDPVFERWRRQGGNDTAPSPSETERPQDDGGEKAQTKSKKSCLFQCCGVHTVAEAFRSIPSWCGKNYFGSETTTGVWVDKKTERRLRKEYQEDERDRNRIVGEAEIRMLERLEPKQTLLGEAHGANKEERSDVEKELLEKKVDELDLQNKADPLLEKLLQNDQEAKSQARALFFTGRFGSLFHHFKNSTHWFILTEVAFSVLLGIVGGVKPENWRWCQGLSITIAVLFGIYAGALLFWRPYAAPLVSFLFIFISCVQFVGAAAGALFVIAHDHAALDVGAIFPFTCALLLFLKVVFDAVVYLWAWGRQLYAKKYVHVKQNMLSHIVVDAEGKTTSIPDATSDAMTNRPHTENTLELRLNALRHLEEKALKDQELLDEITEIAFGNGAGEVLIPPLLPSTSSKHRGHSVDSREEIVDNPVILLGDGAKRFTAADRAPVSASSVHGSSGGGGGGGGGLWIANPGDVGYLPPDQRGIDQRPVLFPDSDDDL